MQLSFEPIRLNRQSEYHRRLQQCSQASSDYSFINLWSWAGEYNLRWAWDEHLVWIKQTQPAEQFWAPIGDWERIDWPQHLPDTSAHPIQFTRVPQALADILTSQLETPVTIEPVRGHWDYLYDVGELIRLSGNRFHKKKNLVKQFQKKYRFEYAPFTGRVIDWAMQMQSDWCLWRDCEASETLAAENRAIQRTLAHWDRLENIVGGALITDDRLIAYTVGEKLTADTLLIHFEKANQDYKGAYQAINQQFLEHEGSGFTIVNREQDLDSEGLRKAKKSYNPVDFLRKYQVSIGRL